MPGRKRINRLVLTRDDRLCMEDHVEDLLEHLEKHKKISKADIRRYTLYIKEHLTGELKKRNDN